MANQERSRGDRKRASGGSSKKKSAARKGRGRIQAPEIRQVKPIFAVAPTMKAGTSMNFTVRLEKLVPNGKTETYDIRQAPLGDGSDGDATIQSTVPVKGPASFATFPVIAISPGWIFFRFTERSQQGQVLGAVLVTS
jgi:hypothetical protein